MTGWECSAKRLHADPRTVRKEVRQIIPVSEPWHVVVAPYSEIYDGGGHAQYPGRDEGRQVFPVVGWALLEGDCGGVQPLFVDGQFAEATWPSEYRVMNHDCGELDEPPGQKFSTKHNITVARGAAIQDPLAMIT